MNLNQRTVTIKLTRTELTNILLLLEDEKWFKLLEKICKQLKDADEKFSREE